MAPLPMYNGSTLQQNYHNIFGWNEVILVGNSKTRRRSSDRSSCHFSSGFNCSHWSSKHSNEKFTGTMEIETCTTQVTTGTAIGIRRPPEVQSHQSSGWRQGPGVTSKKMLAMMVNWRGCQQWREIYYRLCCSYWEPMSNWVEDSAANHGLIRL